MLISEYEDDVSACAPGSMMIMCKEQQRESYAMLLYLSLGILAIPLTPVTGGIYRSFDCGYWTGHRRHDSLALALGKIELDTCGP